MNKRLTPVQTRRNGGVAAKPSPVGKFKPAARLIPLISRSAKENIKPAMQVPHSHKKEGANGISRPVASGDQPRFAKPTEDVPLQRPYRRFVQTKNAVRVELPASEPSPLTPAPQTSPLSVNSTSSARPVSLPSAQQPQVSNEEPMTVQRPNRESGDFERDGAGDNSIAGRPSQSKNELLMQRPYRRFVEERDRDLEYARQLQAEEELGASGGSAAHRNPDPTAVDELLARQLQAQEQMGLGGRNLSTLGDFFPSTLFPPNNNAPENDAVEPGSESGPVVNLHVINRRMNPQQGRFGRNPFHRRRPIQPPGSSEPGISPVENLPEGELDPAIALFTAVSPNREEAAFLNIMRDPNLMLLMLMMRAPQLMVPEDIDVNDYDQLLNLAERLGEVRSRGMSQEEIGLLREDTFGSHDLRRPLDCRICLSEFSSGDRFRCLPCHHRFHSLCIDRWLGANSTCPICRGDVRIP